MNIYEKMTKITDAIQTVAKNLNVAGQYNAVGEGDVLKAVKPTEKQFGIYSYPIKREVIESSVLTDKKDNIKLFLRVETTYRFINIEKPEEYIDIISYGDGVDTQDKAPGKAMTYSDKYALLKAYKIETGDDPDKELSGEYTKKIPTKKKDFKGQWMSESRFNEIMKLTDPAKIQQAIDYYQTDTHKMKNEYKDKLIVHLDKMRTAEMNGEVDNNDLF